jgi:DNA-directed RNA polymerase specialized sigma24 family protein
MNIQHFGGEIASPAELSAIANPESIAAATSRARPKTMNHSNGRKSPANGDSQQASLREALRQMIRRLTPNAALRDDLLQEALVHLWLTETRRPDQTRSWYIQSCRFHLQHYLSCGRSIDSAKRWRDQLPINDSFEDNHASAEPADSGNSVFTCVSAREIIELLAPQLTVQGQAVLHCLADGLGPREIGRKLKLSHTMVIRYRRKIASLFARLELPPLSPPDSPLANGAPRRNGNGSNGYH